MSQKFNFHLCSYYKSQISVVVVLNIENVLADHQVTSIDFSLFCCSLSVWYVTTAPPPTALEQCTGMAGLLDNNIDQQHTIIIIIITHD